MRGRKQWVEVTTIHHHKLTIDFATVSYILDEGSSRRIGLMTIEDRFWNVIESYDSLVRHLK